MRPENKLEGSGDGGMWMKTGIFQSNAGLTRCIEKVIALVHVSPVGGVRLKLLIYSSRWEPPALSLKALSCLHLFICVNNCGVHRLWCSVSLLLWNQAEQSVLINEQSSPGSMNLVRQAKAKRLSILYLPFPHRNRKLRIANIAKNFLHNENNWYFSIIFHKGFLILICHCVLALSQLVVSLPGKGCIAGGTSAIIYRFSKSIKWNNQLYSF